MQTTEALIVQVKAARSAQGLKVVIQQADGALFTYYPKTTAQKTDFLRRARQCGATILAVED